MLALAFASVLAASLVRESAGLARASVWGNRTQRWFGDMAPEMVSAYFRARQDTLPAIKPNVSDDVWYRDVYAFDVNNPLANLSYFSPAVAPTKEQVAQEEAKERAALEALMPTIKAEAAEAEHYYREEYPFRRDDDLENFTTTT